MVYPPVPPGSQTVEPTPGSLDNWQFVGYYITDGETRAVFQNDAEDSYAFAAVGDKVQNTNYTVESISTQDHGEVVLVCGHTRQTLKPVQDFGMCPLQGATVTAAPTNPNPNMNRGPMMGPGGMGPGGMGPGMRGGPYGGRGPMYLNPNARPGG